ncbi:iron ABC transporter permease [Streptomyces sp. AP-93]|uniref:FecCD family ABC transporter permease n=1 Tax=Streptomyces sp. AP-93 TaxID=2929048 RepID=UPI001FB02902|nr:iron ABC transporter permease [Streptomyces sp. AP-93]MCJ0874455.1 iron ABC transporter permease [Streptomyces sp. AP-93]
MKASRLLRSHLLWLAASFVILVLLCLLSLALGTKSIPLDRVVSLLFESDGSEEAGIVREMRLSRTLYGLLVGSAIAVAGALMQALTRNPLADPGILGVSAGAALGIVVTTGILGITSVYGYVWFGFAGALLAMALVYALGSAGRGGATPAKLALAGAAVSALLQSLVNAVLLFDAASLGDYRFWAVGSLTGQSAGILVQVLPFLLAGAVLAALTAPALNSLALGDGVAKSLGQRVGLIRLRGAAAVTLLAGGAVALCGPIAFVGLVVPQAVRHFTGPDNRWILAHSALIGPILLLAADILGRLVARPDELHVGIVVTVIGAPFFIALVRRRRLQEL